MGTKRRKYNIELNAYYLALSSVVGIMNAVLCYSEIGSLIMVALEICVLLFCLLTKKYFQYVKYYIIFITLSFEFGTYYGVKEIFGFKETRIFGVGVATLAILPIVFNSLIYSRISLRKLTDNNKLKTFVKLVCWIFIIGFSVGLFQILINDNNINKMTNVWRSFFGEVYTYIILLVFPTIAYSFTICRFSDRIEELKSVLIAILFGIVITQLFCFITPYKGKTWDSTILLVTFAGFYTPLLVCFAFYFENSIKRFIILLLGIIGTVFSTVFTLTSGGILVVFMVPLITLIILRERHENDKLAIWTMIIIIVSIIGFFSIKLILSNASILLEYKLSQALSLLKIWEPEWYTLLPPSVKFRFQELANICCEYINKPYCAFFGKGIMGTCLDYNKTFYSTHYVGEGGFTLEEWNIGAFFSMHESTNVLLLSSGLLGMTFLIWTLKESFKHLYKSPFLIVGAVYVLFHYTYSFTASNFGIMCLLVGLFEVDRYRDESICQ